MRMGGSASTATAPSTTAEASAPAVITREPRARRRGAVAAPIVDGDDLDILVIPPAVGVFALDAQVREMHLVIEVRQVVFERPFLDLVRLAIRPTIRIVAVPITFVQPLLILALELVVEDDMVDARALFDQPFRFGQVRTVYLDVMFDFARLLQLCVELLGVVVAMVLALMRDVTPRRVEQVTAVLGQDDGDVPMAVHALGSDKPLFTEVPQVTRTRISRPAVVVPEVARRD